MSTIGSRLTRLRRQSGETSSPDGDSADGGSKTIGIPQAGLRNRIQRMAGARRRQPKPKAVTDDELADRLGGLCVSDGLILVERHLPRGEIHGNHVIGDNTSAALAFFGRKNPVVFMDTETTGLAGGTGTLAFLLGMGKFTADGLQVRQYFLTGFKGETALLGTAERFLAETKTLVTFNGKGFDNPLLATRYRLAGLDNPFARLDQLDLLYPTRSAFAGRWPDCRLQSTEQRLLGFRRRGDLPGSEAPETWFRWVRFGDARSLPALLEHHHQDIVSLAVLLPGLHACFIQPLEHGADILGIARHRRRTAGKQEAYSLLRQYRTHLEEAGLLELARQARRYGHLELALEIWSELAEQRNLEALENLAKHYEHIRRDPREALRLTRRLLELSGGHPDHSHREKRLMLKLEGL